MSFLNHAYSLLPFLYFGQLKKDAGILIITDHAERVKIDLSLFPLSIYFCVPREQKEQAIKIADKGARFLEPQDLPHKTGIFDLVIVDLETTEPDIFIQQTGHLLSSGGRVVVLDWSLSRLYTVLNLPFHIGWLKRPARRFHDIIYWLGQAGLKPEWYFLPEPDLNKPRYLVKPGFLTKIPSLTKPSFRQRLKEWGLFYLLPRHKVIVACHKDSKSFVESSEETKSVSANSLIDDTLVTLFGEIEKPKRHRKKITQLYISTTNVLTLQAANAEKEFFIRFPFSPLSCRRLQTQEKLNNFLQNAAISQVPKPVKETESADFPCFVEEGLSGRNIEQEFAEMEAEKAKQYYQKAQEKIREVHLRFGHIAEMDDSEFTRHVQMRLDVITEKLRDSETAAKALSRIRDYFREELLGKTVFISICHGDLKIGNCLFDEDGGLTGIIDWDMAEEEGLTLVDISSLLAKTIRQRQQFSLADILLKMDTIPGDFLPIYHQYFDETKTTLIPLFTALLFYWLDRVYKQISFDPHLREEWINRNVLPIIENIETVLGMTRFLEKIVQM